MQLTRLPLVAAGLAAAILLSACSGGDGTAAQQANADTAPVGTGPTADLDFTATQLSGDDFSGTSLEGKDTVLWFWAPWCTSCRLEAPAVVQAAADFDGSVEVIGVAGRGEVAAMEAFVSDTGTSGLRHVMDPEGTIWTDFGVIGQPAFAFVNDDGSTEVFVGGLGGDALAERMTALSES